MKQLLTSVFIFAALLSTLPGSSQALPDLSAVANLYHMNEKTINEIVYLHTDREVYAPADTLWFKAYIRGRENLEPTKLSKTLFVNLVNEQGEIVHKGRFFIEDSDAMGQFTLNHKLKEGVYYIMAHSSWMKNFDPEFVYKKKLLIKNEQSSGLQMILSLDRNTYYPGDSIIAFVSCFDEKNRDVADIKYSYRVFAGKETFAKGRMQTSSTRNNRIQFILGDRYYGTPFIEISGSHKGERLDTTFSIPAIQGIHVDFFPEGGRRISGMESSIAFKAQTLGGDAIGIRGNVVNYEGSLLSSTQTEHEGMGSFSLSSDAEQNLYFLITDPPGFDSLYPLPIGMESGWQLSGSTDRDKIDLVISRKETPGDIALITLMIRGHLWYNTQLRVDSSIAVEIPTASLPPGIAVLTLFDHQMQPQAERLFHIIQDSEPTFQMLTERKTYVPRDKVRLDIRPDSAFTGKLKGSYSLSIVDAPLCLSNTIEEPHIQSSFLLSPEIRGKIDNPNYYLRQDEPKVRSHFDLLLRTQGWRNYTNITEKNWQSQASKPYNQEIVSGVLLKQNFGKLAKPSKGEINVFFGGGSEKLSVDESGMFFFTPEYNMKFNSGILASGTVKGSNSYVTIEVYQAPFQKNFPAYLRVLMDSIQEPSFTKASDYKSIADQFSVGLAYHEWIDEVVVVKSGRRPEIEDYDIIIEDFMNNNKREARPEYIETAIDVMGILYNMGIPVEYKPEMDVVEHLMYPQTNIGWVVDGSYYGENFSFVQNYVPASIERFTVVKHFETMYFGPDMPEVVVSIRLKTFDRDDPNPGEPTSKFSIPRFAESKEFYKPRYNSIEKRESTIPDIRKTIHWEPKLEMDENGLATVDFYNGDRYTSITCILEGITEEGIPIHSEYTYNVALSRD